MVSALPSWLDDRRWPLHPWVRIPLYSAFTARNHIVHIQKHLAHGIYHIFAARFITLQTIREYIACEVSRVLNVKDYVCHLGDIQIGMVEKKGALEVEVIRARGLVGKPGSKALPGK